MIGPFCPPGTTSLFVCDMCGDTRAYAAWGHRVKGVMGAPKCKGIIYEQKYQAVGNPVKA